MRDVVAYHWCLSSAFNLSVPKPLFMVSKVIVPLQFGLFVGI